MPGSDEWHAVRGPGLELTVPPDLAPTGEQGIDGPVSSFEGHGLRLMVDRSPFADPLTGYQDKAGYERHREQIAGETADLVTYLEDDGTRVLATRLPGPVTAVVHAAPEMDPEIALRIVRSIRPTTRSDDG